jgi:hypothetical protein
LWVCYHSPNVSAIEPVLSNTSGTAEIKLCNFLLLGKTEQVILGTSIGSNGTAIDRVSAYVNFTISTSAGVNVTQTQVGRMSAVLKAVYDADSKMSSCSAQGAASLQMQLRAVVWVGVVFSILVLLLARRGNVRKGDVPLHLWRYLYCVHL